MNRTEQQHIASLKNAVKNAYKIGAENHDAGSRKLLSGNKKGLFDRDILVVIVNHKPQFVKLSH